MRWDGTITLGNVISLAVFIVTIIKMHLDNRERLAKIENKIDLMWGSFSEWFGSRWDPSKPDRRGRSY